jgi:hypothetical protein
MAFAGFGGAPGRCAIRAVREIEPCAVSPTRRLLPASEVLARVMSLRFKGFAPCIGLNLMAAQLHVRTGRQCEMADPNIEGPAQEMVATDSSEQPETVNSQGQQEEIVQLAHKYWMERGCPIGSPEEDWLRAEAEVMSKRQQTGDSV